MLIAICIIIALIIAYAMGGRRWLKRQPWTQGFFNWLEPIEVALWKKSEQVLVARSIWGGSLIVSAYDGITQLLAGTDTTPIWSRVLSLVYAIPPDLQPFAIMGIVGLVGALIEYLRHWTTKPLEVVAIADKDLTPQAAEAVAIAEAAKEQAVAAVNEAKAV